MEAPPPAGRRARAEVFVRAGERLMSQFAGPRGPLGAIAVRLMARKNRALNELVVARLVACSHPRAGCSSRSACASPEPVRSTAARAARATSESPR
jgi:hypothetical protein